MLNFHRLDFRQDFIYRILTLLIISFSYSILFNQSLFISNFVWPVIEINFIHVLVLTLSAFGLFFFGKQLIKDFHSLLIYKPKDFVKHVLFLLIGIIAEELAFNGFLLNAFVEILRNPFGALLLEGIIFGFYHAIRLEKSFRFFAITGLGGMFSGVLFFVTGNLIIPIIVHSSADLGGYVSDYITSRKIKSHKKF